MPIEQSEYTRTTHHPRWINHDKGWKADLEFFDENDPGRQTKGGCLAFGGHSSMFIDNNLLKARNPELVQLGQDIQNLTRQAGQRDIDAAWATLNAAEEATMLDLAEEVLIELTAFDRKAFPVMLGRGLQVSKFAGCQICACTPGVVMGAKLLHGSIPHDLAIGPITY